MKNHLKKTLISILLLLMGISMLNSQTDPFYIKIFHEGKEQYQVGKYSEAAESFKIAEFGLMEEKDLLLEIYLYCALTQLHLDRLKEASEALSKIESELHIKDFDKVSIPVTIYNPIKALRAVLDDKENLKDNTNWRKTYRFELLTLEVMENLETSSLENLAANIEKLEPLANNAPRYHYIKGIFEFRRNNYKACVRALEKITLSTFHELRRDKIHHYLSLSYYYLGKRNESTAHYNQIIGLELKKKVFEIIKDK